MRKLLADKRAIARKTMGIIIAVVIVIAAVSVYAYQMLSGPSGVFKIGVLLPFTGAYGIQAIEQRDAFLLALEEINQAGGILGKRAEAVIYDDQLKVDVALTLVNRLVEVDKVDVLAGALSASTAAALNDKAKELNIPYFAFCLMGRDGFTKAKLAKGTWNILGSGWDNGYVDAYFLTHNLTDVRKVYIIIPAYSFGYDCRDGFLAGLQQWGQNIEVLGIIECPVGTADFSPYLSTIMAANPDLIFTAQAGNDATNFLRQANLMGVQQRVKILQPWSWILEYAGLPAEATLNVYFTFWYFWNAPEAAVREYGERFRAKYGRYPDNFGGFVYEFTKEMARLINLAGSTDPTAIEQAASNNPTFMTMKGQARWGRADHRPVMNNYLYIGTGKPAANRTNYYDVVEVITSYGGEDFLIPLSQLGYP
ncbi:MAG: ABC transporter substrate-binding protein [Candidatus Bathyarchaeia archaeon]